jgi:hypothetical protein
MVANPKIKDDRSRNDGNLGYGNVEPSFPFLQEFHHPTGSVQTEGTSSR